MKKINGLLLASLLIFTPLLSVANEIEHETNAEQIEGPGWGKTILHGASSLLAGFFCILALHEAASDITLREQAGSCILVAGGALVGISSGVALYDLHKKRTLPVCSVKYDTPSSEIAPLNK